MTVPLIGICGGELYQCSPETYLGKSHSSHCLLHLFHHKY